MSQCCPHTPLRLSQPAERAPCCRATPGPHGPLTRLLQETGVPCIPSCPYAHSPHELYAPAAATKVGGWGGGREALSTIAVAGCNGIPTSIAGTSKARFHKQTRHGMRSALSAHCCATLDAAAGPPLVSCTSPLPRQQTPFAPPSLPLLSPGGGAAGGPSAVPAAVSGAAERGER